MNRRTTLTCLTIPLLALAGCGGTPPGKDGGAARSVNLTAVAYTTNTLTGETLDRFIADVRRASAGAISLVKGPPVDPGAQDGSADVIGQVRDGTFDIGIVASRTFDLQGTTSLQALNAPLILESPEQAATFLSDPVTEGMLDGLDTAGVVGLALTYDQMVQPLGFDGPLTIQSLKGAFVLARPSKATSAVLAGLGAVGDPRNGNAAEAAINAGDVAGSLTSMDRVSGPITRRPGHSSAVTGNVQLAVKANVIIVNPKVWTGLTTQQQDALRSASTATRAWAAGQTVSLTRAAQAFCARGIGDVAVADAKELASWRLAVEPAVTGLASADPRTRSALDRMREIVQKAPSTDLPSPCTAAPPSTLPTVVAVGDQTVLAGTWRLLVEAKAFAAAGASQQDVGLNVGTWTFTFGPGGTYSFVEPRGRHCDGTFAVAADRLSLVEDPSTAGCDEQWELTFHRDGDRMSWVPTPEYKATYPPLTGFFAAPLELIAGPPA